MDRSNPSCNTVGAGAGEEAAADDASPTGAGRTTGVRGVPRSPLVTTGRASAGLAITQIRGLPPEVRERCSEPGARPPRFDPEHDILHRADPKDLELILNFMTRSSSFTHGAETLELFSQMVKGGRVQFARHLPGLFAAYRVGIRKYSTATQRMGDMEVVCKLLVHADLEWLLKRIGSDIREANTRDRSKVETKLDKRIAKKKLLRARAWMIFFSGQFVHEVAEFALESHAAVHWTLGAADPAIGATEVLSEWMALRFYEQFDEYFDLLEIEVEPDAPLLAYYQRMFADMAAVEKVDAWMERTQGAVVRDFVASLGHRVEGFDWATVRELDAHVGAQARVGLAALESEMKERCLASSGVEDGLGESLRALSDRPGWKGRTDGSYWLWTLRDEAVAVRFEGDAKGWEIQATSPGDGDSGVPDLAVLWNSARVEEHASIFGGWIKPPAEKTPEAPTAGGEGDGETAPKTPAKANWDLMTMLHESAKTSPLQNARRFGSSTTLDPIVSVDWRAGGAHASSVLTLVVRQGVWDGTMPSHGQIRWEVDYGDARIRLVSEEEWRREHIAAGRT